MTSFNNIIQFCIYLLVVLWTEVLRTFLEELTRLKVDIFVWTGCKVGYFLMYFGLNFSSALLVIISIEKFIVLYFPFKTKTMCTVPIARRVSLATAVIFLTFDSQFIILGQMDNDQYGSYCHVENASPDYREVLYAYVIPILYSYGPFTLMILANVAILYKFIKAKYGSTFSGSQSTNQALSKSAIRGTAMLLTVSFTFIILTGPIAFANSVFQDANVPYVIYRSCIIAQYLNHGINGILYCISGSRFRNELRKTLCLQKERASQNSSTVAITVLSNTIRSDADSETTASASRSSRKIRHMTPTKTNVN